MKPGVLVLILILAPALGGCKMFLIKSAVRLAVGPEVAERIDPVAGVRRAVLQSLSGTAQTPASPPRGPTTPP